MEKHLRNAPTYAVIVALVIQVTRVSDFGIRIGAGWLAWVYAIFLALTIYALAYWVGRLKYEVTASPDDKRQYAQQVRMAKLYQRARTNSQLWLILFLAIDGSLNFAETMSALPASVSLWEYGGAAVYGVFPTLAAFGLGSLQAMLDRIPAGASKPSFLGKIAAILLARMDASDKQGVQVAPASDKQEPSLLAQGDKQDQQVAPANDKQDQQVAPPLAASLAQDEEQIDKPPLQDYDLLAYLTSNPQASDGQAARHFGVSRQAIQQRRRKLIERGAFMMAASEQEKTPA